MSGKSGWYHVIYLGEIVLVKEIEATSFFDALEQAHRNTPEVFSECAADEIESSEFKMISIDYIREQEDNNEKED